MSSRQRVGLRPPRPGDATLVPSTGRRRPLYRACSDRHDQPWWYSSRDGGGAGRFDLALPRGTAYWAQSPVTAVLEATWDPDQVGDPVLTVSALLRMRVWEARGVGGARSKLADTTVASVPTLTAEIATVVPYRLPQAWADAFDADGRRGILYRSRLGSDEAVALFGPSGRSSHAAATPKPAIFYYEDMPAAWRAGLGSVGPLHALGRAPAP